MLHHLSPVGDPILASAPRIGDAIASVYENLFTIACRDPVSSLRTTADGRILVAALDRGEALIVTLRASGDVGDGSRFAFPGDEPSDDGMGGNGCRGFTVAADGAVLAWGFEGVEPGIEMVAARTEFIVYEASGDPRPGWPRGSRCAASRPVLHGDGSVSYVSAIGRFWRHDPNGEVAAGSWPYRLAAPQAPYSAPEGRTVVLDQTRDGPFLVMLERVRRAASGWPVRLPGAVESRCLFGDTTCSGDIAPLVTSEGRAYLGLATGSVVAIDPDGRIQRTGLYTSVKTLTPFN